MTKLIASLVLGAAVLPPPSPTATTTPTQTRVVLLGTGTPGPDRTGDRHRRGRRGLSRRLRPRGRAPRERGGPSQGDRRPRADPAARRLRHASLLRPHRRLPGPDLHPLDHGPALSPR